MIQILSSDKTEAKPQTQSFLQMFKEKFSGSLVDLQNLREARKGKGERSYTNACIFLWRMLYTHTCTHTCTHTHADTRERGRTPTRPPRHVLAGVPKQTHADTQ